MGSTRGAGTAYHSGAPEFIWLGWYKSPGTALVSKHFQTNFFSVGWFSFMAKIYTCLYWLLLHLAIQCWMLKISWKLD